MHPLEVLRFYRILPWGEKGSWIKLLGYALLGYALSHRLDLLILFDLLVLAGIFMYGFSLNDYLDFLLEGDVNYVGEVAKRGRKVSVLLLLPLSSLIFLFFLPFLSSLLLSSFLLILTLHSLPPLRTKDRFSGLGYLLLPAGYTLTTIQAHLLLSPPPLHHLLFLLIVFLAACQDELLGLLLRKEEMRERRRVERMALSFSLPLLLLSLLFLPFSPFFLITTIFSLVKGEGLRRIARRGFRLKEDPLWRKMKPMGLSLSMYHLGTYALLSLLGLF
ncbi:MAG: hypothetical protein QXL58_03805 [Candidatus Hadarchaeales archaeon]